MQSLRVWTSNDPLIRISDCINSSTDARGRARRVAMRCCDASHLRFAARINTPGIVERHGAIRSSFVWALKMRRFDNSRRCARKMILRQDLCKQKQKTSKSGLKSPVPIRARNRFETVRVQIRFGSGLHGNRFDNFKRGF